MAAKKDPLVVRLTPSGVGAIAVVLVEGQRATEAVAACFSPNRNRPLADLPIGRIVLGRWGSPEGEELIVCRRAADRVEVHPHGGRAAVDRVVQDLAQYGAVECSWQEWAAQDESCPIRAAAHIALAAAPTRRTAAVLLDQFHGALRRELESAISLVKEGDEQQAVRVLAALADRCEFGRHLTAPWRVVLAGPPNVGKSSLINALVGYQRAVVYDQPGTTRDVVTARTAIDGWPVELSDTAGLRKSSDRLEAEGVLLAERVLKGADAVVFALDATMSQEALDEHLAKWRSVCSTGRSLVAINKVDLIGERRRVDLVSEARLPCGRACLTSATTREGIDGLLAAVAQLLVPSPPAPDSAVPFLRCHAEAVQAAIASVDCGDLRSACVVLENLLAADPPLDTGPIAC